MPVEKSNQLRMLGELNKLQSDATAMLANIEWNLGALVGAALVINKPSLVNRSAIPKEIILDELGLNGFQILGLDLASDERQARIREVLALGHRCLICESTELAADVLFRAVRILQDQKDPYLGDAQFGVDLSALSSPKKGKSGSLISIEQRNFMGTCAVVLRCLIRHNNARFLPHKSVIYDGTPASLPISINQQWLQGSSNELNISLKTSHDIFRNVSRVVSDGLTFALAEAQKKPT